MNLLHAFYFIYEEKCSETLKTHTENADQSAWEQKKSRTQTHKWVCKAELLAIEPNGIRATKRVCIWQLFFHGSLFAFPSYNKHTFSFSCHFFYLLISFHFIWTFFFLSPWYHEMIFLKCAATKTQILGNHSIADFFK